MADRTDGRGQGPRREGIGPRGPGRHGARIERAEDVRGTLRRLLATFGLYRVVLVIVVLLVAMGTLLNLLAPFLMGLAIDRFIAAGDRAGLLRIVLLMLGAYAGAWVAQAGQFALMATISQRVLRDLRARLFVHLQSLSLSYFDRHPHGELMSRLTNDLDVLNRVLSQQVTQTVSGLLTLVGILVMIFAINFWLALGSMVVFPIMVLLVGWVGRRTRSGFRDYQMRIGQLNGQLEEMFSGQRVITAFGQEARALADFDRVNEQVRDVGIRAQTFAMLVPPLMGILSNANIAILAGLGGWMVLQGLATVGTIATFYNYSRRFAAPLRQLGNLYNQLQSALAGAERVFNMIDEEPELPDALGATELGDVTGE
ncbi:MAG: ABC transporter ATP-binding protein, partial [Anaerolineae bacterium]